MENTNLQDLARRAAEANGEIEHFNTVETAPKTTPMQPEYHEDDVPTVFIGSPNPLSRMNLISLNFLQLPLGIL